jgi:hypothetical protein
MVFKLLVVTPTKHLEFHRLQKDRDKIRATLHAYKDSLKASKYKKLLMQIAASSSKRFSIWEKLKQKKAEKKDFDLLTPMREYSILEQQIKAYEFYDAINDLENETFLKKLRLDSTITEKQIKKLLTWKDKKQKCFSKFKKAYSERYIMNHYSIKLDFSVRQQLTNLYKLLAYEKEVMNFWDIIGKKPNL